MWDKQGVLRGACSCAECQEFMAGQGVRCDYCDCSPTKHKKIHVLTTSDPTDYSQVTFKRFPEPPDALKKQGIAANFEAFSELLGKAVDAESGQDNGDSTCTRSNFDTIDGAMAELGVCTENDSTILVQAQIKTEVLSEKAIDHYSSETEVDFSEEEVIPIKKKRTRTSRKKQRKNTPRTPSPRKANAMPSLTYRTFMNETVKKDGQNCTIVTIDRSEQTANDGSEDESQVFAVKPMSSSRKNKRKLSELRISHRNSKHDRSFECQECTCLFTTNERALRHIFRDHSQYKFVCVICKTFFQNKSAALRHQNVCKTNGSETEKSEVDGANNKSGETCVKQIFAEINSCDTEKIDTECNRNTSYSHPCLKCNETFRTRNKLRIHNANTHVKYPFNCRFCPKVFRSKVSASKHEAAKHADLKKLEENVFKIKVETDIIKKEKTARKSYKCGLCDETFQSWRKYKQHEKAEHEKPQYTCPVCTESFQDGDEMDFHIEQTHADETSDLADLKKDEIDDNAGGICPHCGKDFPNALLLRRHINTVHSDQDFLCQYCDKKYRRKHDLIIHERLHTGQRPFTCSVCSMTFRSKNNLYSHQTVHEMRGAYQCQYCGRRFDSKHGVTHHERSHTGEKPYQCTICDKRFAHRCVLTCHERVHSGERPFICKFCERGFKDQSTLRKHIRIHTHEKPYKCSYCDRAFNQKWYVKVHEKCHTGGTTNIQKERKQRKQASKVQSETKQVESHQILPIANVQSGVDQSCVVNNLAVLSPPETPTHTINLTSQQPSAQQQPLVESQNYPQVSLPLSTPNMQINSHVIANNHGNASMAAVQTVFPTHHHSMIEIMGQSLETLEQQYTAAQRMFAGYLNTLPASVLGASASGAPADGSCSGHIPY